MTKFLPGVFAFFLSVLAHAEPPPEPPVQENELGTAIFAILFFGSCAAVAWMVWRNHKKEQQQKQREQKPG